MNIQVWGFLVLKCDYLVGSYLMWLLDLRWEFFLEKNKKKKEKKKKRKKKEKERRR